MSTKNKSVIAFGCGQDGKANAAHFDISQEAAVRTAAGQKNWRIGWPKSDPAAVAAAAKVPDGALTDKGLIALPS